MKTSAQLEQSLRSLTTLHGEARRKAVHDLLLEEIGIDSEKIHVSPNQTDILFKKAMHERKVAEMRIYPDSQVMRLGRGPFRVKSIDSRGFVYLAGHKGNVNPKDLSPVR